MLKQCGQLSSRWSQVTVTKAQVSTTLSSSLSRETLALFNDVLIWLRSRQLTQGGLMSFSFILKWIYDSEMLQLQVDVRTEKACWGRESLWIAQKHTVAEKNQPRQGTQWNYNPVVSPPNSSSFASASWNGFLQPQPKKPPQGLN